jgi:phosphate butyryltransferase
MKSFEEIIKAAAEVGPKKVALAGEPDEALGEAIERAGELGMAECTVYADAVEAVRVVRDGDADVLMKGSVSTCRFMGAVLDKEQGLCAGSLMSHIAVVEVKGRLLLITDGGICLNPGLEEKIQILKNAVPVARMLGMAPAKVAVLAAVEKVNQKMPETVDAEQLMKADIPGLVVQGPLAVDNAVSMEAAKAKNVKGPVAGQAEILLVPSVLVGNIFAKGIMYFADSKFGGIVAGASRPVCFLSRADTADNKLNTLALGVLMSKEIE